MEKCKMGREKMLFVNIKNFFNAFAGLGVQIYFK